MSDDLFGGKLPGTVTYRTKDGRDVTQPVRGKHYTQPKGYAKPPGTGPAGETCGSCKHRTINRMRSDRTFPKCLLARHKWTGGRGSDILVRSPACSAWEKQDE